MDENADETYQQLRRERFGPDVDAGPAPSPVRAFAAPLVVSCPWCRETLVLTLAWWLNGLGDVWGTGQIALHVCSGRAVVNADNTTEPLF